MKFSWLDAHEDRKFASGRNSQGVIDGRVNEVNASTVAPGKSTVAYSAVEWTKAEMAVRNIVAPNLPST